MTEKIYHIMCSLLQNYKKKSILILTYSLKNSFLTKGAPNCIYLLIFDIYYLKDSSWIGAPNIPDGFNKSFFSYI